MEPVVSIVDRIDKEYPEIAKEDLEFSVDLVTRQVISIEAFHAVTGLLVGKVRKSFNTILSAPDRREASADPEGAGPDGDGGQTDLVDQAGDLDGGGSFEPGPDGPEK